MGSLHVARKWSPSAPVPITLAYLATPLLALKKNSHGPVTSEMQFLDQLLPRGMWFSDCRGFWSWALFQKKKKEEEAEEEERRTLSI